MSRIYLRPRRLATVSTNWMGGQVGESEEENCRLSWLEPEVNRNRSVSAIQSASAGLRNCSLLDARPALRHQDVSQNKLEATSLLGPTMSAVGACVLRSESPESFLQGQHPDRLLRLWALSNSFVRQLFTLSG